MVKEKEKKKERVELINRKLLKEVALDLTKTLGKYDLSDPELVYIVTYLYQGMMDLESDRRKQSIMSAKLKFFQKKIIEEVKRKDL